MIGVQRRRRPRRPRRRRARSRRRAPDARRSASALAAALARARRLRLCSPDGSARGRAATSPRAAAGSSCSTSPRASTRSSYRRLARVLRTIVGDAQPVGLVIYSDSAYEMLPPGTRGDELRPLLRFFEPPPCPRSDADADAPAATRAAAEFGSRARGRDVPRRHAHLDRAREAREMVERDGDAGRR